MQVVLALDVGGTERLVVELVKKLSPGVTFAICCLDREGELARELRERQFPITVLGRQPGFHPTLAVRLARLTSAWNADILHCHHYSPFVYGQLSALYNRRLQVLFTEHGRLTDSRPSRKRGLVNPLIGRLGARMFAVSRALRDHMVAEGLPSRRIQVVHNGVDPGQPPDAAGRERARARLGLGNSEQVLGTIARLDPVKGIGSMIQALRHLASATRLVIVGDGPMSDALRDEASSAGLSHRVLFCGQLTDARTLLPAFDVYLNSSLSEGISISILEAMAACVPVVATRVGGTPEIIVDGHSGCLVPPGEPTTLAKTVRGLLASPAAQQAIGVAGRQRVVERFTFDRMADSYLEAYLGSGRY